MTAPVMTQAQLVAKWNADQRGVARQVYIAFRQLGLFQRAATIGILTGMVENSLRGALPYGDKAGYKGYYQQSDNWVPKHLVNADQDPRLTIAGGTALFVYGGYAAGTPGMLSKDWINQPIGVTCQQVQGSNTPTAYTKLEPDAYAMMTWLIADPATRAALAAVGL